MDELVMQFGSDDGLLLELTWEESPRDDSALQTAAYSTRASLRLSVRGQVLWQGDEPNQGFPWTWVELLEYLAHAWPYLVWEEGLPFALRPAGPAAIEAQAEARWDELSAGARDSEEVELEAFEDVHNLARAVQGASLRPLWIIREGDLCWVCTDTRVLLRPFEEVIATLEGIGEAIAERVRALSGDERSPLALKAWQERTRVAPTEAILIATGLSEDVLEQVEGGHSREAAWELHGEAFERNELIAAARLAGGLPPAEVAAVVQRVRAVPRVSTPDLDNVAGLAADAVASAEGGRPFEQGLALARWLRDVLAIGVEQRVDPDQLLGAWGVEVERLELRAPDVDAFACWGPRHGPAVFINKSGRHNLSVGGVRATLAHEIAHLLLDRRGALPSAEVLGGRTSAFAEARARAFAAELLLPSDRAGGAMAAADNPERAMRALQQRYRVSQEVVAWQARNSGVGLSATAEALLRTKVSRPWQF